MEISILLVNRKAKAKIYQFVVSYLLHTIVKNRLTDDSCVSNVRWFKLVVNIPNIFIIIF